MTDAGYGEDVMARLRRHRWSIFLALTIAYFFVYFHRLSVSIVGSDIVEEVGGTIGTLSSVYFWTYTAMQIPCGLLTDRFGPRAACSTFLTVASVGSLITFAGNEFWMMVLGKMLIAAGMAVVYVPLMKLISVWFPKRDFAVLSGVVIAVGNVGAIAASGPLSVLAEAVGWRDVFLILGIVTLLIAMACVAVIRDHPSRRGLPSIEDMESSQGGKVEESSSARIPVLRGLRIVLSGGRRFWPCALAYFLVYGSIMVFQGTWAVKYFDTVYGFELSAAWMITALGIGKILSTVAIGAMTTRGMIGSKKKAMFLGTSVFAAIWAAIFFLAGDVDSYWFWFAVSFLFGFFGGFMTLTFASIKEWYPIAIAGTAVSAANLFLFLGASVGTTVSGWMIGKTYTLENFSAVWGLMLASAIIAAILLASFRERGPDDPLFGVGTVSGDSEERRGTGGPPHQRVGPSGHAPREGMREGCVDRASLHRMGRGRGSGIRPLLRRFGLRQHRCMDCFRTPDGSLRREWVMTCTVRRRPRCRRGMRNGIQYVLRVLPSEDYRKDRSFRCSIIRIFKYLD